jgi:hypothetical protein
VFPGSDPSYVNHITADAAHLALCITLAL